MLTRYIWENRNVTKLDKSNVAYLTKCGHRMNCMRSPHSVLVLCMYWWWSISILVYVLYESRLRIMIITSPMSDGQKGKKNVG